MPSIHSVAVYCSSSRDVARVYFDAAAALGDAIARQGWQLVYGGNDCGCMGALAGAARNAGGKVIGITPQRLVDEGIADEKCDELLVTQGMRERKALMEEKADAFITLPGGLGTLEEILEILVGSFLGFHAKPIVLLNIAGFYDPLLAMIDHGIEQRFIRPRAREMLHVCATVRQAIDCLRATDLDSPPSVIA
ncbi:MAG TPA: TIGR00730 family Rossman fold protein [Tepidisphaeraceae bacterium]|nr:TIGR00730 family Rossman fold protein [Tepidisphaeraceae bacterium]